jgi:uncharacterized membrane protein
VTRSAERCALGLLLLLLFPPAAGCTRSDPTDTVPENTDPPSGARPTRIARYRGLYIVSETPDSGTLRLCGGGELEVQDRTGGDLRRAHEALGSGPEGPVFVEVRAEAVGTGTGPGAVERIAVLHLVRATPVGESAGCAEPPARYRFRASGNEPFWAATVEEDSIVFEQPEEPRRFAVPRTGSEEGADRRTFHARTSGSDAHVVRMTLLPGRCADSMSGALYSFSAEVVFDGKLLSGCARAGDLDETP